MLQITHIHNSQAFWFHKDARIKERSEVWVNVHRVLVPHNSPAFRPIGRPVVQRDGVVVHHSVCGQAMRNREHKTGTDQRTRAISESIKVEEKKALSQKNFLRLNA